MTQAQLRTANNLSPIKWLATYPKSKDLVIRTNTAQYTIAPNGDVTVILEHVQ